MTEPAAATKASGLNSRASKSDLWVRYCGFLDLSTAEFMRVQERLLSEQLARMHRSSLWHQVTGGEIWDATQFRHTVRVTNYDDYAERLRAHDATCLAEKPQYWMHTSGRSAEPKAIPYTADGYRLLAEAGVASLALSCARHYGDWRANPGLRVVYNMPPKPFYSGYMTQSIEEMVGIRFMPSSAEADKMTFEEKIRAGFKLALRHGLDVAASQTSVLLKMAEGFADQSNQKISAGKLLREPAMTARIARAWVKARLAKRAILPRDLWQVKSLISYGMDTHVMKGRLKEYWGAEPYEFYGSTETGSLAMQSWERKGLYFTPYSVYVEFTPESEIQHWLKDRSYAPQTVLMDQVKVGESYELLVTSFHGMPFARYRMEDSFRCIAAADDGSAVKLPQFEFAGRAQDLIDLAGFAQLTERDLAGALAAAAIQPAGWSARKETEGSGVVLRFYIESQDSDQPEVLAERIHQSMAGSNFNFRDLESMLGLRPIRVTPLAKGSFRAYYEAQKAAGASLVKLKPPVVNAGDETIDRLQAISRGLEQPKV